MKLTRKNTVIISISALALLAIIFMSFGGGSSDMKDYFEVVRGSVIEEVSLTGKTEPSKEANLAFETTGRIRDVRVSVGDSVYEGQVLASLDTTSSFLALQKSKASLAVDEANLREIEKGTRQEDLVVYETKLRNAETYLNEIRSAVVNSLKESYTKADNAVRNSTDQFFTNPRSINPDFVFTVSDMQLKTDVLSRRVILENVLVSWNQAISLLDSKDYLNETISVSEKNLSLTRDFLDKISLVVNGLTSSYSLSQTTINTYKSDVSSARTSVDLAISNLSSARQKMEDAMSSLTLAKDELAKAKAGSLPEKIEAAKARVLEDKAQIAILEHEIETRILRAPISGRVTKVDARIGEMASPSNVLVSLHGGGELQIEANVPEADVSRIKVGNEADVTLDAYGSTVAFKAKIIAIDPAETLVENVPTYKTTFAFVGSDERIKSGMTANINIVTSKREDVLIVPGRAVFEKDGMKYVRVMNGEEVKQTQVKTGLKGIDGNIEIISGLSEGEKILLKIE